jgi:dihydrodipicolinate synthase/N-acetylneuraminate lyase
MDRRDLLRMLCAAPLAAGAAPKALRGIFPIAQTPFTAAGKLDLETLAKEVKFLARLGVHGVVWPQLASEYWTLSEAERLEGAEAILAAGRGLAPALVIGVQAPDADQAVRYARHAARHGAGAVIALPPPNARAAREYYTSIGGATDLPLIAQTTGDMSVDSVIEMARAIPTLRYVKDEAGVTLPRLTEFRQKAPELHIFTGNHGRTLIDEMRRGSAGDMPGAAIGDLYAAAWDLWHEGKEQDAIGRFSRVALFITELEQYGIEGLKYLLHLRGVFPSYAARATAASPAAVRPRAALDAEGQQTLRQMLEFVKPYLRA